MKIYMGDKMVSFTQEQLDYLYHSEGTEGTIYRYQDFALKIYHNKQRQLGLSEEEAKRLMNIKTARITLPQMLLYDEKKDYIGYAEPFFMNYSKKLISKMKMKTWNKELEEINHDVAILSQNQVKLEDVSWWNYIYNGEIHLVDPGSYHFVSYEPKKVKEENKYIIDHFLLYDVLIPNLSMTKKEQERLKAHFKTAQGNIGQVIQQEASTEETVKTYVKRICKL